MYNTIEKFDSNGNGSVFATANSVLDYPLGLAFDKNGNLYAANAANNTIGLCRSRLHSQLARIFCPVLDGRNGNTGVKCIGP